MSQGTATVISGPWRSLPIWGTTRANKSDQHRPNAWSLDGMQGISALGSVWNPLMARNRQKPRMSEASQLRRLHDSPPARNRIGSGAAAWPVEGGGRLGPLNATVGPEPGSETGPSSTPGPDSDVIYEGEPAC
jgi:hypothetical protein